MSETTDTELFSHPVPVCPVRGSVLFPTMVMPIDAGRAISITAINAALERDRTIVIVSQRDRDVENPVASDLYEMGTACTIMRMKKNPDGTVQMLVRAFRSEERRVGKECRYLRAGSPLAKKIFRRRNELYPGCPSYTQTI